MRPIILAIMVSFVIPVSADAVLVGRNIISNSSFENRPGGEGEDPRGWGSWNSDLNGIVTNESRSGSQAGYLVCPKTGDSEGMFFTYTKVKPGKEYAFSVYVKNFSKEPIEGEVFGQISIEWFKKGKDKDGKDLLIEMKREWGPKFGPELPIIKWIPCSKTATAPADSDICRFVIQFLNEGGGSGKFFVDDVSAEEVDQYFKKKQKVIRIIKSRETTIGGKEIAGAGLLTNAGFEEPKGGSGNDPAGWLCWNADYNGVTGDKARSGTQSIYISSATKPESHSGIFYHYEGAKPGKEYLFSCYVINSATDPITGGAYGQLSIEWQKKGKDKDGKDITIEISRSWGPSFGGDLSSFYWKLQSMPAIAPVATESCNFAVQFFNKDGKGTFYVDNASVEEK